MRRALAEKWALRAGGRLTNNVEASALAGDFSGISSSFISSGTSKAHEEETGSLPE